MVLLWNFGVIPKIILERFQGNLYYPPASFRVQLGCNKGSNPQFNINVTPCTNGLTSERARIADVVDERKGSLSLNVFKCLYFETSWVFIIPP